MYHLDVRITRSRFRNRDFMNAEVCFDVQFPASKTKAEGIFDSLFFILSVSINSPPASTQRQN